MYSLINRDIYKVEQFLEMDSGGGFLEKLVSFQLFLKSAFKLLLKIGNIDSGYLELFNFF